MRAALARGELRFGGDPASDEEAVAADLAQKEAVAADLAQKILAAAARRDSDPSNERPLPGGLAGKILAATKKAHQKKVD